MRGRCLTKSNPKYHRYGGRGISLCKEWDDPVVFYEWAKSNGWESGLSLDRIDNDGNYEPSNCRWVTISENSKRKSTTKISDLQAIEIRKLFSSGVKMLEIAKMFGVSGGTIWFIVKNITHN